MIEIRNLTKKFGDNTVLQNVNADIREGDVIAVIGPSGTGKSTLIRCLNMLSAPTGGSIIIDGEEITAAGADINRLRRKMGMVFQQFNLFGHLTVLENVMIPQTDILGRSRKEAYEKAMKCLHMVGMTERMLYYPESLSGGQKQRAAIARTLAMDPEIILFDEPTSALDPTLVGEVEYIVGQLAEEGRTMIIVTHEMSFARKVANRAFYMDEKGIYEEGTAEQIFNAPRKEKTRRFIKQLKVLELCIPADGYEMPEIVSAVASYGKTLSVSARCINRLQMAVEELCIQTVIPLLDKSSELRLQMESSVDSDHIGITVSYEGERIDLGRSIDPLSGKLLDFASDEIREEGNTVTVRVKK